MYGLVRRRRNVVSETERLHCFPSRLFWTIKRAPPHTHSQPLSKGLFFFLSLGQFQTYHTNWPRSFVDTSCKCWRQLLSSPHFTSSLSDRHETGCCEELIIKFRHCWVGCEAEGTFPSSSYHLLLFVLWAAVRTVQCVCLQVHSKHSRLEAHTWVETKRKA